MKNKRLSLRISERRLSVLQTYAATKDKTITSLVEDWIDSLHYATSNQQMDQRSLLDKQYEVAHKQIMNNMKFENSDQLETEEEILDSAIVLTAQVLAEENSIDS